MFAQTHTHTCIGAHVFHATCANAYGTLFNLRLVMRTIFLLNLIFHLLTTSPSVHHRFVFYLLIQLCVFFSVYQRFSSPSMQCSKRFEDSKVMIQPTKNEPECFCVVILNYGVGCRLMMDG